MISSWDLISQIVDYTLYSDFVSYIYRYIQGRTERGCVGVWHPSLFEKWSINLCKIDSGRFFEQKRSVIFKLMLSSIAFYGIHL